MNIADIPLCTDAFNCFMYVINIGLRSGGGVGEPLKYSKEKIDVRF